MEEFGKIIDHRGILELGFGKHHDVFNVASGS
jgi:hypothetical protein